MKKILVFFFVFLFIVGCGVKETPGEGKVYILLQNINQVYVYDPENDTLFKDVMETGSTPNYLFFTEEKGYIVNSGFGGSPSIQVFDPDSNVVTAVYEFNENSANPWALTVADDGIYVTSLTFDMVYIFDETGKIVDSIKVGRAPEGIIFHDGKLYVTCTGFNVDSLGNVVYLDSYLYIIENRKVKDSIKVGVNSQVVWTDENNRIVVLSTGNYADITGKIYIISGSSVMDSIDVGGFPTYFVVRGEKAYVVGPVGPLRVVDLTTKEIKEIEPELKGLSGCDVDEEGRIYLTKADWSTQENFLYIIENDTLVNTVSLGIGTGASFLKIKE